MRKEIIYGFADTSLTGLDKVPLNSLIFIEDDSDPADGSGETILMRITSKSTPNTVTGATTVATFLGWDTQWELVGDGKAIRTVSTHTATASQTVFTISYETTTDTDVYINGVKQLYIDQYTLANGTTLTLLNGAQAGDIIEVISFAAKVFAVEDANTLGGQNSAYHLHWDNMTNTPTSISGYGIVDAVNLTSANTWTALNKFTNGAIVNNNEAFQGYEVDGTTARWMLAMTTSDEVRVGSANNTLVLKSSGIVSADGNSIRDVDAVTFSGTGLYDHGTLTTSMTYHPYLYQYSKLTLGGNVTLTFFANTGGPYTTYMHIYQDATGGRTLTLPTGEWVGGTPKTVTSTANAHDLLMIHFMGGSSYVYEMMQDLS